MWHPHNDELQQMEGLGIIRRIQIGTFQSLSLLINLIRMVQR